MSDHTGCCGHTRDELMKAHGCVICQATAIHVLREELLEATQRSQSPAHDGGEHPLTGFTQASMPAMEVLEMVLEFCEWEGRPMPKAEVVRSALNQLYDVCYKSVVVK